MKILITGGAGFIGTNLIKKFLQEGHEIVSVDNYSTGKEENHQLGAKYIKYDIRNISNYSVWGKFDVVYHLAAIARIQPSFINPEDYFTTNANATLKIAKYCSQNNIPLIYAGSSSHHSGKFKNPYTFSKDTGEELIQLFQQHYGLKATIARFYNVYGPHEIVDGDWAAVIGVWRRQVRDGQPLTIVGDGEQRRDFTHVDDIIDGLYKIGISNEKHEDAWELGTGKNYSINEVADMFVEKFGCEKQYIPNQKGNYKETLRENNDAIERLGWQPTDKLKQYIQSL